jgi:hypothetical protein
VKQWMTPGKLCRNSATAQFKYYYRASFAFRAPGKRTAGFPLLVRTYSAGTKQNRAAENFASPVSPRSGLGTGSVVRLRPGVPRGFSVGPIDTVKRGYERSEN